MVATPSSPSVGNQSAVEMTLNSNRPFLPIGEMLVLTIGDQTLHVSRYSDDGSTNQITFVLTQAEFALLEQGDRSPFSTATGMERSGDLAASTRKC
jgi:hypothetical protein